MQKIKYIQKEQGRVEGEEIDFKAKIHTIKMNFKKLNYLIKGLLNKCIRKKRTNLKVLNIIEAR